jgi:hypothetical protein
METTAERMNRERTMLKDYQGRLDALRRHL